MCWPLLLIILVESNLSSEQKLANGYNFCNEREALEKRQRVKMWKLWWKKAWVLVYATENYESHKYS